MRLVVISDSHGYNRPAEKAIEAQSEAKHVFFLGDNTADIEDFEYLYPEKKFHIVCGNCDYCSMHPVFGFETICGKKH